MPIPPTAFKSAADTGPEAKSPNATVETAAQNAEPTKITAVDHRSLSALRATTATTNPALTRSGNCASLAVRQSPVVAQEGQYGGDIQVSRNHSERAEAQQGRRHTPCPASSSSRP